MFPRPVFPIVRASNNLGAWAARGQPALTYRYVIAVREIPALALTNRCPLRRRGAADKSPGRLSSCDKAASSVVTTSPWTRHSRIARSRSGSAVRPTRPVSPGSAGRGPLRSSTASPAGRALPSCPRRQVGELREVRRSRMRRSPSALRRRQGSVRVNEALERGHEGHPARPRPPSSPGWPARTSLHRIRPECKERYVYSSV
jgi:hypothetical protein